MCCNVHESPAGGSHDNPRCSHGTFRAGDLSVRRRAVLLRRVLRTEASLASVRTQMGELTVPRFQRLFGRVKEYVEIPGDDDRSLNICIQNLSKFH